MWGSGWSLQTTRGRPEGTFRPYAKTHVGQRKGTSVLAGSLIHVKHPLDLELLKIVNDHVEIELQRAQDPDLPGVRIEEVGEAPEAWT
jgi:hypothetical protein